MSSGLGLTLLGWVPGFVAGDNMCATAQPAFILDNESLSLCIDSVCKQWAVQKWVPSLELFTLR